VLFPHVALPLHIFEQRYRKMVVDALSSNRLIAIALPRPGASQSSTAGPEIHETVCVGRITAEEKLPGGRFNIVLTGLQRALYLAERVHDRPYRVGELVLLPDQYPSLTEFDRGERKAELLQSFRRLLRPGRTDSLLQQVLDADLPLGVLCDLLAAALRVPAETKYRALSEVDVDLRSGLVLDSIRGLLVESGREGRLTKYPPRFSLN
jgi:Lon protease-like protein